MNERDGFYFHRSFREAIDQLPAKDQLALYRAITGFGLDGVEPEKLTPTQNAFYLLVRPVLAKGRNKAASGKKGGSKRQANSKQTESKIEANESNENSASGLPLSDKGQGSNSNELRLGTSDEGKQAGSAPGSSFTVFWESYPCKIGREKAWEAWKELSPTPILAEGIMNALEAWKRSEQWLEDGGRFVPRATKWLAERHFENPPAAGKSAVPKGASGELGAAELEAIQRVLKEGDGYGV